VKKVIWLLLSIFILFIAASCGGREKGTKPVAFFEYDGSTDEVILENENLMLRFLPETTEIILTDKTTGMEWRSNPLGDDPLADPVTRYMMNSVFALEYADVYGIGQTQYSGEQSVKLGAYDYKIVNGVLEVNYTIGNLERTYTIPPAVPEERMKEFTDIMSSIERSIVNAGYRLYDIDNLRSSDNKDELLTMYPDLENRKLYVLRADVHEYQKIEYEKIFSAAGYTYEDYIEDLNRYPALAGRERPAFNITLQYSLEGNALVLNVPFEKIAYRDKYPIKYFHLMPYIGAGGLEDEGYMLVPDGNGALIYFNNGRQNQQVFHSIVYGWDEGQVRTAIVTDNRSPFPVYGIQNNGNALLCIIENGASYANVMADVSGRNNSWNNVYSRFSMVHSEVMNIVERSQRDVYQYERSLPEGESITLRFIVCGEDGYVGMAKEYRSWLLKKFPSLNRSQTAGVPVAVEIVGAVNKTQHRLGIPFDLPLKLTSYNEAAGMISDIAQMGWKNVNVKLNGWFNRSVDHTIPTRIQLVRALGSRNDFSNIVQTVKQNNYNLFPEVDFFLMKDKKPFDGFNLYRDASRYINRERIQRYPYSTAWFGERTFWGKLSYIAHPNKMVSMIENFSDKASGYGIENIAFRNIASRLTGDYNERQHVSREASMKMRQNTLNNLRQSGAGVMVLAGNAYAAPFADFIVDMILESQNFGITDASVPFFSMALHGLVPYTGRAINLAEDYSKNLLKTIESGAGLYFSFVTEETSILQETKFRQFYANVYHKWIGDADALYRKFSADFGHLYNQAIVNHEILFNQVTMTEYEDGTRVIVNASNFAFDYNGTIINADEYFITRRGAPL